MNVLLSIRLVMYFPMKTAHDLNLSHVSLKKVIFVKVERSDHAEQRQHAHAHITTMLRCNYCVGVARILSGEAQYKWGFESFSPGKYFRSWMAVQEFQSIACEISMPVIYLFREQKMLYLLLFVHVAGIFFSRHSAGGVHLHPLHPPWLRL
jgi:hypothetical protein